MGFFSKIKSGLAKTRNALKDNINSVINSFTKIDEELFEELEEILVLSDIGCATAEEICNILRERVKKDGIKDPNVIKKLMNFVISEMSVSFDSLMSALLLENRS